MKWLREQNELLQQNMKQQQSVIDALTKKVDRLEGSGGREDNEIPKKENAFGLNKVMISGEG